MYRSDSNNDLKITFLATAIALALAPMHAQAVNNGTVMAGSNQQITLTPGQQYTNTTSNLVLEAYYTGGKISGDRVDIYTERINIPRVQAVLKAYNGGQIWLTNSTVNYTSATSPASGTDRLFNAADMGSVVNIANSTLRGYANLGEISNGASAVINNSVASTGRGVSVTGAGSRLDIINGSDITLRGDSYGLHDTGIMATEGGALNIENSRITVLDNGYYDGSRTPPNPEAITVRGGYTLTTPTTTAVLNNLIIETKGYQSNAINIVSGNASATMDRLNIITRGLGGYGLYVDNTNNMASTMTNSTIETFGYSGMGAYAVGKTALTLDNIDIITHGYMSTGIKASVGGTNSNQPTILTATNLDITMSGRDSTGVGNNHARTYLNDIRLNLSGDTSTAISVGKTSLETIAHIDNLTAQVSGNNSYGMFLGGSPDIWFRNSSINMTGNNSHGLQVGFLRLNSSSALPVSDSRIETQDGYAVQSINADLNLDLTRSTLIGRRGGAAGVAISVEDSGAFQSGIVNVNAGDNSQIVGDAVSQSANAAALNLALHTSSTMTGRIVRGYSMALDETSQWNVTGDSDISTLNNGGTVAFAAPGDDGGFKTITVGNYLGGGTLIMNTALGDDSSATDKLIVTGDTAGSTKLYVNNFHGSGTTTVNGIEVISVGGQSDGLFTLENRALAGAYEYFLHQDNGDWYLRSALVPEPPTPEEPIPEEPEEPVPQEPQPPQEPEQPDDQPPSDVPVPPAPEPVPAPTQKPQLYRPEAGAYLANITAANRLFSHSLKDREGRAEDSSLWLRQLAFRSHANDDSGQLQMRGNSYVIQGGGEVWNGQFGEQDRLGVGIMAGYGYSSGNTHSAKTHYDAKNSVHGYSAGAYATWYQNAKSVNGLYVDSWLQYSWLRASVNGEGLVGESYDIRGLSGSLESGYRHPLSPRVFITPQAQAIWSGISADRHQEVNGTRVDGSGSVQTRLGVNLSYDVPDAQKTASQFTVYGEVNWLHNANNVDVTLDNVRVEQAGSRNVGEMKLGLEGQPAEAFTVWANVAQRVGAKGYHDTSGNVGIKYHF